MSADGSALRSRSLADHRRRRRRRSRCATRSTSRAMSRRSATGASGWPSITTCRASPAPRPRWRSPMSRPARARSAIGAGGIMLPNHAPLLIAEQFGTLAALHPGRVDLGLGRAPGSDQITARAMRRNLLGDADELPAGRRRADGAISSRPSRARRCRRSPAPGWRCRSGSSGRAPTARSWRRIWACPSPSPRISRRR